IVIVVNAVTGAPLSVLQENRYLTDVRTGAAGAVALDYTRHSSDTSIGFIGGGAIAVSMARAAACLGPYQGYCFAHDGADEFCSNMTQELGLDFTVVDSSRELCQATHTIFTQTPGATTVVERDDLQSGTTIIASGSDQPTKQELPVNVLTSSKYIADLTSQTSKVGELRSALEAGSMSVDDVYCELGDLVNGTVGRANDEEVIVVDLTGTGAQDAAVGQVAWNKLKGFV
ncbi:MAG: hypothetical protein AAFR36_31940, partial [Bacteroidota bacterium]